MSSGYRPSYDIGEAREIAIAGRGTTQVWDSGPIRTNEIPVLLLHGWNIDAPTNYGFAFPSLCEQHRVVMYDHHGHGHGIRNAEPFTLESAANDAVAVLDALEIRSAIVVGYSLGGAVAQTLLHQHPDRCAGLVLSATAGTFAKTRREVIEFAFLGRLAKGLRRLPESARATIFSRVLSPFTRRYPDWIAGVVAQADVITLLEAGASLGTLSPEKITTPAPVPSSFVVTSIDTIVPMERQVELATELDVDSMHSVHAGHEVPIRNDREFNDALVEAVRTVTNAAQSHR